MITIKRKEDHVYHFYLPNHLYIHRIPDGFNENKSLSGICIGQQCFYLEKKASDLLTRDFLRRGVRVSLSFFTNHLQLDVES